MTEKERIEWLLEVQEHPKKLTDEQVRQMLADDGMRQLVRQLGFAKRAFKKDEAKNHTPNVDDEWEKFAANHDDELIELDNDDSHHKPHFSTFHKFAASFVALLVVSGLAFAAIHIVQQKRSRDVSPTANTTAVADTTVASSRQPTVMRIPQDTITTEPHTFDNVPLDKMLKEIASAYNAEVEFENESARSLRFHFVWKREDSLTTIVEKLNTFDAVNIIISDNKLIVR